MTLCPDLPTCLCLGVLQQGLAVEALSHLACYIRITTVQIWTLKIDRGHSRCFSWLLYPLISQCWCYEKAETLRIISAEVFDGLSWAGCSSSLSLVSVLTQLDRVMLQGATVAESWWLPWLGCWIAASAPWMVSYSSHLKARARKSGGG